MPKVVVLAEYCKSCGLCVEVCPNKVLAIGNKPNQKGYYVVQVVDEANCIGCKLCGTICPDIALEVYK